MSRQSGFTLIELVMVIVILGILAASAIPKFVDVSSDARKGATEGLAGALGSASAINFAVKSMNSANGVTVNNCTDLDAALESPLDSSKYQITSQSIPAGGTANCELVNQTDTSVTASFVGHQVGVAPVP